MNTKSEKRKLFHALSFPMAFLFIAWLCYVVFAVLQIKMSPMGVYPHKLSGLLGIFLSPFAHADLNHLAMNSISFLVLATLLFYFYRLIAYKVFFLNWFISGLLLWIGGRESVHIGASGIVYGLAFFLFFSAIFRRDKKLTALAFIVVFLYGSMFWGMLPQGGNISWEGHLFGAISGVALAFYYRKNPIDFIPDEGGDSVSVTWGQASQVNYSMEEEDETGVFGEH